MVQAARKPVEGAPKIARFLTKVTAPDRRPAGVEIEPARVNGLPGYIVRLEGQVVWVLSLEIDDGRVRTVRIVLNPEKLRHLAP